jgi:signal transduction histidine kinase
MAVYKWTRRLPSHTFVGFLHPLTILLFMLMCVQPSQVSAALDLPEIQLSPGDDAPHLGPFIRYTKDYPGEISLSDLESHFAHFAAVHGRSIQFGRAASDIVILLKVRNVGTQVGSWVFSTDRGSAVMLRIHHLTPSGSELRFDSDQMPQAKDTLRTYLHYADAFSLQPDEERIIVVHSSVEDSAYFPLVLQDRDNFFASSNFTMMLAAGCMAAIFALLILNLFFYLSTGKREFVWLVAAEFFLATVVMYLVGFLSTYFFYDRPMWGLVFGDITKYGYVACMAQFARVFVSTKTQLPKTDFFLRVLIWFSVAMIMLQFFSYYIPTSTRIILHSINYLIVAASALYFTYIGIYATRKLGLENWPLVVAWGSVSLFAVYAACAYSGAIPNLPMSFYAIGPVAVVEAAFATLALGLNISKSQREHQATKALYTTNLQEKLAIAEERSAALATVLDQSALLHASGHDSQQVLLALNSALDAVHNADDSLKARDLTGILESSTSYLNNIVASTLSGARIGSVRTDVLALSSVSATDMIRPLQMMYHPLFQRKGLRFDCQIDDPLFFVTDRALLTRAISNLLANSLKFTDHGGVALHIVTNDDRTTITIEDTGRGLSEALAKQLNTGTEARLRESIDNPGSGSGFRYAQKVVAQLGGHLTIRPAKVGCSVSIELDSFTVTTPCSLNALVECLPDYRLLDWDSGTNEPVEDASPSKLSTIALTYDDSAVTRGKLAEVADLIIYKPVCKELITIVSGLRKRSGSSTD